MKRTGWLLEKAATWDNVSQAYRQARRGAGTSREAQEFAADFSRQVQAIVQSLRNQTWSPRPYRRFVVHDPKQRVIHAAPFSDRVVHHALMNAACRGLERGAVACSFACRVGLGNLAAVRHAAILHAAKSDTFSNCWKLRVISVSSWSA